MDLRTEKEILKKELDQVEDPQLLETIRMILEYGKSKKVKTYEVMTDEDYLDRISESRESIADGELITQEATVEYFKKKNA